MKIKLLIFIFSAFVLIINCEKDPPIVTSITTKPVENYSYTTATVKGSIIDNSGNVTNYGHCWGIEDNPTIADSKTSFGKTASNVDFTSELTGLTAGTKYYVRAYALDGGEAVYSNEVVNFTTSGYTAPSLITINITNITFTSASGGGDISADGGNPVLARGICWATIENPTISGNKTIDGSGTGAFTSSLTELTSNTTYYVRAYATNSVGTAYGNQQNFKTNAYGIPVLTTAAPSNVTHNSASSGGDITSDGGSPVNARGVCWSTSENPTISLPTKTNDGTGLGPFNSTITGLTPNTPYYLRAYATNSQGTSYGNQQPFTTEPEPSISVTSPIVSDHWVGGEQHLISWSFTNVTGNVTISLYSGLTFQTNLFTGISINTGQQEWIVPNGTAYGKDYKIRVTSTSDANTFGESAAFTLSEISGTKGTMSDVHSNVYKTVKIGKQWWMAENLRVFACADLTFLVNGASVGNIVGNYTTKYYFAYNDNDANVNTYGRLYTWVAAMNGAASSDNNPSNVPGACPAGWHIPGDAEWKQMELYIGIPESELDQTGYRGTTQGTALKKDTALWAGTYPETNIIGFSAIPGGYRNSDGGFLTITTGANFWTSTQSGDNAYIRRLFNSSELVNRTTLNRVFGASIRCVKD